MTPATSKSAALDEVDVDCILEIGDPEIDDFVDELRALLTSYREVRLVYGFE